MPNGWRQPLAWSAAVSESAARSVEPRADRLSQGVPDGCFCQDLSRIHKIGCVSVLAQ